MTDSNKPVSQEERQAGLAPEVHNDEQDDHRSQAQEVAMQARDHRNYVAGATESMKVESTSVDGVAGSETDLVEEMSDMEKSGRIDNGAFAGEPNHDDDTSKYEGAQDDA